MIKENSHVWVLSAPGIPYGARVLGTDPTSKRIWLDVCMMGQHLPQMYPEKEITALGKGHCKVLGLCEDCLGFGDTEDTAGFQDVVHVTRSIDHVANPCPVCKGTGRVALRVTIARAFGAATAEMSFERHEYVKPLESFADDFYTDLRPLFGASADMCLACGMAKDAEFKGEAIHVGAPTAERSEQTPAS